MDYIHFFNMTWSFFLSEIMQYKVEKWIYFELIPTSTSRDELGKLSFSGVKNMSNQQEKQT